MYNGIGLNTPRGSGTNGYVVRNLSFVRPPRTDRMQDSAAKDLKADKPTIRAPNKDILLHDRKRKVEVQCMELRIKLEDEGLDVDEVESKVQQLRESLMNKFDQVQPRDAKSLQEHETHQRNAAKEEENKKMMRALKIDSDYVEGAAFDQELQEKKRQERIAKYQEMKENELRNLEKRRRRERSPSPPPRSSRRDDRESRDKRRRTTAGTTSSRRRRSRSPTPSSASEDEWESRKSRSSRRHQRRSPSRSRSPSDSDRDRRSHRVRVQSPPPRPSSSSRRSHRRRSPSYTSSESEDDRRDRKSSSNSRRRNRSPSSDSGSSVVEERSRRGRKRSHSVSSSASGSSESD
ncbi:hypothetical protein BDA99DRAFT_496107 [Phascolomyces articulosus]|uniref:CWF21 domain-containing protein n=1 Tax=Phascolomyces articulosus TaxID=60185 RepID=A0AAD5PI55_9FUNG|nr:hypothetical protein BDA99DRAFT_496107 [Phascolomyces articulosus]